MTPKPEKSAGKALILRASCGLGTRMDTGFPAASQGPQDISQLFRKKED